MGRKKKHRKMTGKEPWLKRKRPDLLPKYKKLLEIMRKEWNKVFVEIEKCYKKEATPVVVFGMHDNVRDIRYIVMDRSEEYKRLNDREKKLHKIQDRLLRRIKYWDDSDTVSVDDVWFESLCVFNEEMRREGK